MDDRAFVQLPPAFNSSDFELSEDNEPAKKRKSGHGIAAAILRNQAVDRRETKKAMRTLQFAHGAPGTRVLHDSVQVSWDAYCQTIGHPVDECPTGERIFQYIDTMIRNSKSNIAGKPAISLSVVRSLLARLIKLLTFRHEHLLKAYTPHHLARIEVRLQQLVAQGKLVRGTWYKKQWISFMTLLRMSRSWFQRAMSEGTYSWDIILTKVTSVVTQSAMSSRSGDITRTQLYEALECLCWKDITLKLDEATDRSMPKVEDLRGTFLLRFTKGYKDTRNQDQPIYCDPLTNLSHNTICAVKLILILALRLGYVDSSTLDGVLRNAAQRADGTIKWTQPDAPVFSQMRKGSSPFLLLERPAGQKQILHTLQDMAHESGMLEERIDTRALRRGALRDHAYVKKAIGGVPSLDVAMLANHSNMSYNMGTTRDYVGPLEVASYNLRSENQRADRMAPAFAEEGPSKEWRRRFTKTETDEYMTTHDLDPRDRTKRKMAGRQMKNERKAQWRDQAKDQPLRQRTASEANLPVVKGAETAKYFPAPVAPVTTLRTASAANLPVVKGAGTPKYLPAPVATLLTDDVIDNDDEDLLIDPRLRKYGLPVHATMESLTDAIILQGEARSSKDDDNAPGDSDAVRADTADEVDFAMQDAVALENATGASPVSAFLSPSQDVQLADVELLSSDDFVRFFSQINIYQSNNCSFDRNDPEQVKEHIHCGNSRDAPTPWLYYCKQRCGYSTHAEHYLQEHELNCNGQAREKPCPCPRRGCDKSFKNEGSMKTHVADVHDYTPQACDQCPHQPEVLYTTKLQLHNHREKAHGDPIEETDCPLVTDCKSARRFTSKKALKKHLKSKLHSLTTDQLKEYVRDSRLDRKQKPGRKNKAKGWHLEQVVDEQDVDEEEA